MIQTLIQLLVRQAHERPLLVIFEDLHWVDPTTLEFLDTALDTVSDHKILILTTARPAFEHDFGGHPVVSRFALNRLGKNQTLSIINKLTGNRVIPDAVLQLIVSRTDGIPLFVEELTKTVLESGTLVVDGDRFVIHGPLDALAIPSTLHDSLIARLDRLQPTKEVAQTAACIGREFHHRLLSKVSPLPQADLDTALESLLKAELIFRRGLPPEAAYQFKHALLRDAAYASLLKERRRSIHASILAALEQTHEAAPEVLANHAEAASLTERAINFWEMASKAAIARPAYDEGISHLARAISLITPQLETGERAQLERALSLQIRLGVTCMSRWGAQGDATKLAFEHAFKLADKLGDTPMWYPVLYGLWVGMFVRAEHQNALQQAKAFVRLAQASEDTASQSLAYRLAGGSLCKLGRLSEAQTHFEHALALYDPVKHKGLETRFGQDLGMTVHVNLAINLMSLGESRRAESHAQETERAALASGDANTIGYAHVHLALLALLANDDAEVARHAAATLASAFEYELDLWLMYEALLKEIVAAGKGDKMSIERFMAADATFVGAKARAYLPQLRVAAGWCALAMNSTEQAVTLASMARAMIDETGECVALSDAHRLQGALAFDAGDHESAEACLLSALAVAREQGSKLWELRAANDLARLWSSTGRTDAARELLQLVDETIAGGDCPRDRGTTRVMLAEFAT